MVTTIQVSNRTLEILRQLKQQMQAESYEETIMELMKERGKEESLAGHLQKYVKGKPKKDILKGLRDENDRF
jgi:hypothetical protein